ncbi:Dyp-type peroxidase [Ruania alkalisoli]|uniref:Dyp-type peroxidase n=1 Tax=Ruania alkalisoli TaxID=2779775 RepID=A0A7M1SU73_9MICO|nr:Dyp-type peroxidase [Ruania alkalisoli]QOR71075.1 Dyp-type peroxidase [Ruania alkalisoli]
MTGTPDEASPAEGVETPRASRRRREFLTGLGAATVAGVGGWVLRGEVSDEGSDQATDSPEPTTSGGSSPGAGQPGITHPAVPQRHVQVSVLELTTTGPRAVLDAARTIATATPTTTEDAGDVTVTVGIDPHNARSLWPERAALATELPTFDGDTTDLRTGGHLVVQVCAETAVAVRDVTAQLTALVPGSRLVWESTGYRDAPTPQGTTRTGLGFVDGIIAPRTEEELTAGVWTGADQDTYVVLRRMTILSDFTTAPVVEQERAIGRRRDTGAPLSGGETMSEIDLFAKSPDGQPMIPASAHARRAHPANIGRPLMLRRSYSFDTPDGSGLLFVAFLSDPETFVATQRRLDEQDDLIRHTITDASGCFFVPGSWET